MKAPIISLMLIMGLLLSCTEHEGAYSVKHYENVQEQAVEIEGLDSLFASDICVKGNLLVLQTRYGDKSFHLADLETGKLLRSFGTQEGPEGFKKPRCYCQFLEEKDSTKLVIRELRGNIVNVVNVDELLSHNTLQRKRFSMPSLHLPKNVFLIDDQQKMIGGGGVDGMIFNYSIDQNRVRWSNERPAIEKNYPRHITDFIYTAVSDIDEKSRTIAVAYVLFNRIDLFNFDGSHQKTLYFDRPKKIEPILDGESPALENINYYAYDLEINEGQIFLLYKGEKFEFEAEAESTQIHVIDYEGNLHKALKVDHVIRKFDVTDDNSAILAVTDDDAGNTNVVKNQNLIK